MQEALASPRRWSELYLAAPVDTDGVRLVEGFADLLFEGADGLVLVDYKTDETINPETRQHYAEQLAAYAELIERATGMAVTARRILHLSPDGASVFTVCLVGWISHRRGFRIAHTSRLRRFLPREGTGSSP